MKLQTLADSAQVALSTFGVGSKEPPDIIPTGFPRVDAQIGGLFPGTVGVLGAQTGIGKSSVKLSAARHSSVPVGLIEMEDTPDVVGSRVLAEVTGIDSKKMRTNSLSPSEVKRLQKAQKALGDDLNIRMAYPTAGTAHDATEAVRLLSEAGCKMVWLDYLQKIKGDSDNRRNVVGNTLTSFQRACAKYNVAGMIISQVKRLPEHRDHLTIYDLKECGEIENEARLILLGWQDKQDYGIIHFRMAKCNYGGVGTKFSYKRDQAGVLKLIEPEAGF